MESIYLNEIGKLSLFFNQGTQAYVYHDKKYAYKIYKFNQKASIMFHTMDMDYQLERLSEINLDSYVTPKFMIKDHHNHIAGYGMDYIKGNTLNRLNLKINVDKFIDDLKKLEEDTYKISEVGYSLRDENDRNIIYSDTQGFKVIDLDYGRFDSRYNPDDVFNYNMGFIKDIIVSSVFGISLKSKINTCDGDLLHYLYSRDSLTDFIEYIDKDINKEKVLIKDIRRRKCDFSYTTNYYGHN